ncbi:hypothetical protein BKA81DRAFT_376777 [Phyllosticta paracitricarpa]
MLVFLLISERSDLRIISTELEVIVGDTDDGTIEAGPAPFPAGATSGATSPPPPSLPAPPPLESGRARPQCGAVIPLVPQPLHTPGPRAASVPGHPSGSVPKLGAAALRVFPPLCAVSLRVSPPLCAAPLGPALVPAAAALLPVAPALLPPAAALVRTMPHALLQLAPWPAIPVVSLPRALPLLFQGLARACRAIVVLRHPTRFETRRGGSGAPCDAVAIPPTWSARHGWSRAARAAFWHWVAPLGCWTACWRADGDGRIGLCHRSAWIAPTLRHHGFKTNHQHTTFSTSKPRTTNQFINPYICQKSTTSQFKTTTDVLNLAAQQQESMEFMTPSIDGESLP